MTSPKRRPRRLLVLLFVLLLAVLVLGLHSGQYPMPASDIRDVIFGRGNPTARMLIWQFRLPRLVLALLVGFGMGMSGSIMQTLLHNDLASPGTLGVSAGSGLFVTVYVAYFKTHTSSGFGLCMAALVGGLMSAILIFILGASGKLEFQHTRLIMTGIALSSAYGAIGTILMFLLDPNRWEFLQRWNAGELWGTKWPYIATFFVWLLISFLAVYAHSATLDVIALSYDMARGLGVNIKKSFLGLAFCAVAMASSSVAFGGNFFFLGLIGPHITRRLIGTRAKYVLPASAMVSAMIVLLADMAVNRWTVLANIPTGIIISVLSVPYFLYLMIRR